MKIFINYSCYTIIDKVHNYLISYTYILLDMFFEVSDLNIAMRITNILYSYRLKKNIFSNNIDF